MTQIFCRPRSIHQAAIAIANSSSSCGPSRQAANGSVETGAGFKRKLSNFFASVATCARRTALWAGRLRRV